MDKVGAINFVLGHVCQPSRDQEQALVVHGDKPVAETTTNLLKSTYQQIVETESLPDIASIIRDDPRTSFILISASSIPDDLHNYLQSATDKNLRLWVIHIGRDLTTRRKRINLMEAYGVDVIVPQEFEKHAFIRDFRRNLVERMLEQYYDQSKRRVT